MSINERSLLVCGTVLVALGWVFLWMTVGHLSTIERSVELVLKAFVFYSMNICAVMFTFVCGKLQVMSRPGDGSPVYLSSTRLLAPVLLFVLACSLQVGFLSGVIFFGVLILVWVGGQLLEELRLAEQVHKSLPRS